MKTKIMISLFLSLLVLVFYISKPTAKENKVQSINSGAPPDSFLIGALANGSYQDFAGYKKANMNLWHIYTGYQNIGGYMYPYGWVNIGAPNDYCLTDISQYVGDVKNILLTNKQNGMMSLMQRPKIEFLAYGQSSIYQCENVQEDPNNNSEWFYSYDNHETNSNDINDGQETPVKFCDVNDPNQSEGYVVKYLRANRELCNTTGGNLYQDNSYDWYILPKIRVDSTVGDNTPVCRVEIRGWDNNFIKSYELRGGHFKYHQYYSGLYIDKFNLNQIGYEPLIITLSEAQQINPNNHGWSDINTESHFDIRVYWYALPPL